MKICTLGNQTKRILFSFLIAFVFMLASPTRVQASTDVYLIQTAVNDKAWTIEGAVVKDTIGWLGKIPLEGQRFGDSISALTASPGTIGDEDVMKVIKDSTAGTAKNGTVKEGLPLSYPSYADTSLNPLAKLGATEADKSRATAVLNALLYDFQLGFDLAYPDRSGWTIDKFQTNVVTFLTEASKNGGKIDGVTFTSVSALPAGYKLFDSTSDSSDYIKATANGVDYYLMYRIPKGYADVGRTGLTNLGLVTSSDTASMEDVTFINWDMLVAEAVLGYHLESSHQVNVSNVSEGDLSAFESMMVGFFDFIYQSVVSMLNLWPIEQLIFNQGLRGTNAYSAGIFPQSWEGTIWGLFMVSQLIAMIMLLWVLIQTAAQRAMSTVNFMDRIMAWERIKKIIFAALILAVFPVTVQLLMQLSDGLTQVIVSALGDLSENSIQDRRDAITTSTGGVGVIFANMLLIGIDCYYNFVYTLRGLMVAMLIVSGPIFVVLSITGKQYQKAFGSWASQLLSNIFVQPIHALAFTLILSLPQSTRSFENLLMIFATIPFTTAAKKLFFPDGGDFGENTAMQAKDKSSQTAKQAAGAGAVMAGGVGALAGGAWGGARGKENKFSSDKPSGSSGGLSGGSSGGGSNGVNPINGGTGTKKTSSYNSTVPDSEAKMSTGGGVGSGGSNGGSNGGSGVPNPNSSGKKINKTKGKVSKLSELESPSASQSMRGIPSSVVDGAKSVGKGFAAASQIAGGTGLTVVGAGLTAAGMGQVGHSFAKGGRALMGTAGHTIGTGGAAAIGGISSKVNQIRGKNKPTGSGSIGPSGYRIDKMPKGVPLEESTGKFTQANPLYQHGNTSTSVNHQGDPMTSTNMSQFDLADAGISNLISNDHSDKINFDVDGSSDYGKEMAAHCSFLEQCETPEDRQALVEQTGIDVTPIMKGGEETGSFRVGIDKNKYRSATGSDIHTDKKGNMTVNSPGEEVGNLIPQYKAKRTAMKTDEVGGHKPYASYNYDLRPTEAARVAHSSKSNDNEYRNKEGLAKVSLVQPSSNTSSSHTTNSQGGRNSGGGSRGTNSSNTANNATGQSANSQTSNFGQCW